MDGVMRIEEGLHIRIRLRRTLSIRRTCVVRMANEEGARLFTDNVNSRWSSAGENEECEEEEEHLVNSDCDDEL